MSVIQEPFEGVRPMKATEGGSRTVQANEG